MYTAVRTVWRVRMRADSACYANVLPAPVQVHRSRCKLLLQERVAHKMHRASEFAAETGCA